MGLPHRMIVLPGDGIGRIGGIGPEVTAGMTHNHKSKTGKAIT